MRTLVGAIAASGMVLSSPAVAVTYNCSIESPVSLQRNGDTSKLNHITVGNSEHEPWKFSIKVVPPKTKDDLPTAVVDWPTDPIQIAGSHPLLPTSDASNAFVAVSGGPCLFTEQACATLVQIVDQSDKTAMIEILPSAIGGDEKNGRRPFVAIMEGTCTMGQAK